mgnify:CR=1 FL=1
MIEVPEMSGLDDKICKKCHDKIGLTPAYKCETDCEDRCETD